MALKVISGNLPAFIIRHPELAIRGHEEKLRIRSSLGARAPLMEEFSILIKHLNAAIGAVDHEDVARLGVHGDSMNGVEIPRTRFVRRITLLSPGQQEFSAFIELS